MVKEIEKKYLLFKDDTDYTSTHFLGLYSSIDELVEDVNANGKPIKQGYLPIEVGQVLAGYVGLNVDFEAAEARLRDKGGELYFTLKGKGGLVRNEAECMLEPEVFGDYWGKTEGNRVEKIRLKIPYQGDPLEIDVYTDRRLIVAEIEVDSVMRAERINPIGRDITEDKSYKNKNLAK
tara:strand:+ start:22298 stop:22831 length:534 start_codon:yes stop_codon:yes gene_type:complete